MFEIVPVSGYHTLGSLDLSKAGCVLCLNVGGMVDISEYISTLPVYILDSHRPLNLNNAFSSNSTHVIRIHSR